MIIIYYVDKPFLCESLPESAVNEIMDSRCTRILLEHDLYFMINKKEIIGDTIHIFMGKEILKTEFHDIKNYYKYDEVYYLLRKYGILEYNSWRYEPERICNGNK